MTPREQLATIRQEIRTRAVRAAEEMDRHQRNRKPGLAAMQGEVYKQLTDLLAMIDKVLED